MWPLNLPARLVLRLPGAPWIAWAVFDADWYRATYPEHAAALTDLDAALRFYFDHGQRLGHSPNAHFDETWHRAAFPAIGALVAEGRFESAFDAYCRGGARARAPHWMFDEAYYREQNQDLTETTLTERGLVNGYDHFLWRGEAEGRRFHPLIDPGAAAAIRSALLRGEAEPRVSVHFDPEWYCARYPTLMIGPREWALRHYLDNPTPTEFDPNPSFSEAFYLEHHPDARDAVRQGRCRNGYDHFLRHGMAEGRAPRQGFDLAWYGAQRRVRDDLAIGLAPDAFTHFLLIGQRLGLPTAEPSAFGATETLTRALFRARAEAALPRIGRNPPRFDNADTPELSVIMVLHNQYALTLNALASLRANFAGAIEVILVDSGSSDASRDIGRILPGARVLRFDTNIGFVQGCNAALPFASADAVLYLNNDVELAPNAIAAALRRLRSDDTIGVVGGMVLRSHGKLQEAGCIVWSDGSTEGYLRDADPTDPGANFVRDVDFCSGVFLLCRRSLLEHLGGFDPAYAPAYYEDVDLCRRARVAGFRVVYDPAAVIHHLEYGSAESARSARAEMARGRAILVDRHAHWLRARPSRHDNAILTARSDPPKGLRILFIEDQIPLRSIGSGFVRANDILRAMADRGDLVTVFPMTGCAFDLASVHASIPDTVEIMHDHVAPRLAAFLAERRDYYDVIWVGRTHNLPATRAAIEAALADRATPPRLILDTEAVTALREAEHAALEGRGFDLPAALRQEFRLADGCEHVIAVSASEAEVLRDAGLTNVSVLGHQRPLDPTPRPFARRAGMLFLGAIHRMDSPNYDSLCWFVDEVLPLIETELGWRTRLTIAGFTGAEVRMDRFADHPRVTLRGEVANLAALYDQHHVLIAPTRFAAGIPYKVHEAASFGVPVVATELLRRQLGWSDGVELLACSADDPAGFAGRVIRAQRDEALWTGLRAAALERLRIENSAQDFAATIDRLLTS
jgi:GT2 family glycosyltransferase